MWLEALSLALILAANSIVFSWVYDLEKCGCSGNWKREALKYSIPITVILGLIAMVVSSLPWKIGSLIAYDFGSLFVLITLLVYVIELRSSKCECSKSWREQFSMVWSSVLLGVWALNFLMILGLLIYNASIYKPVMETEVVYLIR